MFSALRSILPASVAPVERIPPSSWDPSTPLPAGSYSTKSEHKIRITERSKIVLKAEGSWSHGTVLFESTSGAGGPIAGSSGGSGLPSYDDAIQQLTSQNRTAQQEKREDGQLAEGEAELLVKLEARWNDEKLWEESEVTLESVGGDEVILMVKTPTMSTGRLMSQLSFHLTFVFPSLPSIASLTTSASQWRHLAPASFSSLFIHSANFATTNAPLSFDHLRARELHLLTSAALIEGQYEAEKDLNVKAHNTSVKGRYTSQGKAIISTNNRNVNASFSAKVLEVRNSNGAIKGDFVGRESILLETSNKDVEWSSLRMRRTGVLRLKTVNGGIKGVVELVDVEAEGEGQEAMDDKKAAAGGSSSSSSPLNFIGSAKSANGPIDLRFLGAGSHSPAVDSFTFDASSPNGKVSLELPAPWNSAFSASTSNGDASFEAPASHGIVYDEQDRTKVEGHVSSEEGAERTKSKVTVSSSNRDVSIRVV